MKNDIGAVEIDPLAKEVKSPADICLKSTAGIIDFHPEDVFQVGDNHHQLPYKLEIRAWVCPWCGTSTEYILLNGCIVTGCGMSSLGRNGKTSDCCGDWLCRKRQEEWHAISPANTDYTNGGSSIETRNQPKG